ARRRCPSHRSGCGLQRRGEALALPVFPHLRYKAGMRRRVFITLIAGARLLGVHIASTLAESEPPKGYDVFKGERLVLTVRNRPGPLVSTALAPPGRAPASHPFLSGAAHAPDEEPSLRAI